MQNKITIYIIKLKNIVLSLIPDKSIDLYKNSVLNYFLRTKTTIKKDIENEIENNFKKSMKILIFHMIFQFQA